MEDKGRCPEAYAYITRDQRTPFDILRDRYINDEEFRGWVKFGIWVLFFIVLLSGFSMYLGVSLWVIWAFIGGCIFMEVLQIILRFLFGGGFGVYSFFVSFFVGLGCAFYVQLRQRSY